MIPAVHAHCSYCGNRFASGAEFPRICSSCGSATYLNPIPVGVVLLPVDAGILAIRRTIEPGKGLLALPGGYLAVGETWQEGAARELREETGVTIDPAELEVFRVATPPDPTKLVVFAATRRVRRSADLPPFEKSGETSERLVMDARTELAFELHTEVAREWFRRQSKAG